MSMRPRSHPGSLFFIRRAPVAWPARSTRFLFLFLFLFLEEKERKKREQSSKSNKQKKNITEHSELASVLRPPPQLAGLAWPGLARDSNTNEKLC